MIPLFTRRLLKKHLAVIEMELNKVDVFSYPNMTLKELGFELERVLKLQGKLQEKNQWGYGNATIFTWMLRHLATTVFKKSEQWVLDQIKRFPLMLQLWLRNKLKSICRMCDEPLLEKAFRGNGKEAWKVLSWNFQLILLPKRFNLL
jgi:hypothetical protein